ncbi:class GN sortase [Shewanella sp. D64]|uniref:class GN sortase n=1 Tax=unclassified Shewanella TaxID=196818 RepID=UPI0022BA25A8|nr:MULTISPECIES: class GN sortase [unclassified Shewanella]MEC4724336.1 class GN sortase [Shewanella sp. D64]MEC4738848.1 class GN sortase [Shewanella sp. E94]WBJ97715.1 class GN sortase [Shewanella sp. MTB7]
MFKRQSFHRIGVVIVFVLAVWFLGQGVYMQAKAHFAQYLIEQAWERSLKDQQPHKPWSWADTYPIAKLSFVEVEEEVYESSDERFEANSMYVLEGGSGRNLAFGPVEIQDASNGKGNRNRIIAGHNDTHFSILEGVKRGKLIKLLDRSGTEVIYKVMHTQVVHESDTHVLAPSTDKQLTLITCYPFRTLHSGGALRFIVHAEAVG